jgi:lysophospholipase L1-like esterase
VPVYNERLRLVTLGDGYTAGTSTGAPKRDSWPAQLVQVMAHTDTRLQLAGNLALGSRTSEYVLNDQLPQVGPLQPDLVTLQVGANDIITVGAGGSFSGARLDEYRDNVSDILDGLLEILPADRIFVITIPDHNLTEKGQKIGPPDPGNDDVSEANAALAEVAGERGVAVVDISPVYELVVNDPSLVLAGGPDPSARQFAGWVQIIGRRIREALSAPQP